MPPLLLWATPRELAKTVTAIRAHRPVELYDIEITAQPRASWSDAAHTRLGPERVPLVNDCAASATRMLPIAAPVSPNLSAGCSIHISGRKKSSCRIRATPHSLESKLSPLNPANVVAIGAGAERRLRMSAMAADRPSPFAGSVPYRCPGSITDAAARTIARRLPVPGFAFAPERR